LKDEPLSNLDFRLRIESRSTILQRRLDIITVMRDGVVAQSGPPLELHDEPVDLFVAQFLNDDVLDLWQPLAMGLDARSTHVFDLETGMSLNGSSNERAQTAAQASATVRVT
jgi:ABC-type sugar transport system ATPase subunit